MGKNRDFFKKIGDIEGTFHAKMGVMKDRHGKDITEAKRSKSSGKNTPKNYTKSLSDPNNHDGVVTHLEQDILECEVKWAFRKHLYEEKVLKVMEFQLSYFKS